MKLASYHGTRPGIMGLGNILIRARLRGRYSHTEIMFEPGDGVDHLMPDGTCEPDANGAYWMVSSVGLERMPAWSRRAGKLGGLRFKRVVPDPHKWTLDETRVDAMRAAVDAHKNEGALYDWQLILQFLLWVVPEKKRRGHCAEWCAQLLGVSPDDAWRLDPCSLPAALRGLR
jgi:hypothetical protein